jgi:hypothetical protein
MGNVAFTTRERLLTRDGHYVTTVETPVFCPPVDLLIWGYRLFLRTLEDEYRESTVWVVQDPAELDRAA